MLLVLASANPHKLRELQTLMAPHQLDPLPAGVRLGPELGDTYADNALDKARTAAAATGRPTIADDSGIEAQALGGAPGVRSARYAGPAAIDAENLAKLLHDVPAGSPLRYVCALVFVDPIHDVEHVVHATCDGRLAAQPRGDGGFGYDPAFLPDDERSDRTMAQLTQAEKDAISHRGRAARLMSAWLTGYAATAG